MAPPVLVVAGKKVLTSLAANVASRVSNRRKQSDSNGDGGGNNKSMIIPIIAGVIAIILFLSVSLIVGLFAGVGSLMPSSTESVKCSVSGDLIPDDNELVMGPGGNDGGGSSGGGSDPDYTMLPESEVPPASSDVYVPVEIKPGHRITSPYGPRRPPVPGALPFHHGTDYSNGSPTTTPIFAAADGVVISAFFHNGSGNLVYIQHNMQGVRYISRYAHMSSKFNQYVKKGDQVKAGQRIGTMGSTGTYTTGPHLHFEVRTGAGVGSSVNSATWLSSHGAKQLSGPLIDPGVLGPPGGGDGGGGGGYNPGSGGEVGVWEDGEFITICDVEESSGPSSGAAGPWGGYENGKIPVSELCTPGFGPSHHKLRCDAAKALESLNAAYRAKFGKNIEFTDTYRDYAGQVACRQAKGSICATPGTSNHGWGLAVDFSGGINSFGTPQHLWMVGNAPQYGWIHPSWAQSGGSKPEPWHWEFVGNADSVIGEDSGKTAASARTLARHMLADYGWDSEKQFSCLNNLWNRESGWNYKAANPVSTARGIPQAMMSAHFGPDWQTNAKAKEYLNTPRVQIEWGLDYIKGRYSAPCAAWAHSERVNWY